jgi:hypothetical protein
MSREEGLLDQGGGRGKKTEIGGEKRKIRRGEERRQEEREREREGEKYPALRQKPGLD